MNKGKITYRFLTHLLHLCLSVQKFYSFFNIFKITFTVKVIYGYFLVDIIFILVVHGGDYELSPFQVAMHGKFLADTFFAFVHIFLFINRLIDA